MLTVKVAEVYDRRAQYGDLSLGSPLGSDKCRGRFGGLPLLEREPQPASGTEPLIMQAEQAKEPPIVVSQLSGI